MKLNRAKYNIQALLESLILLITACLIFYLTLQQKYLAYVTPKMKPYLFFTAFVLFLWGLFNLKKVTVRKYSQKFSHLFILILPVILFILPHQQITSQDLSSGFNTFQPGLAPKSNPQTETQENLENEKNSENAVTPSPVAPIKTENESGAQNTLNNLNLHGYDPENKTIYVAYEEFYPWLSEIFNQPDNFNGYEITLDGFVYRDAEFTEGQDFIIARMLMSCCIADVVPIGIYTSYQAADLPTDTWIKLKGLIQTRPYLDSTEPVINIISYEIVNDPPNRYVYPF